MSLRALDKRDCPHHGPASLFRNSVCVSCEREFGAVAPPPMVSIEPIPEWMRKAILGVSGPDPKPMTRHRSGVRGHECSMSDMERSVFERLGWGLRPGEISEQLGVSFAAVSNTITRIQDKVRVGSREQLRAVARKAAREKVQGATC